MTPSTRIVAISVLVLSTLAACGSLLSSRPRAVYETASSAAGSNLANFGQEPVTFTRLNLALYKQALPISHVIPDADRNRQRKAQKCGVVLSEKRLKVLHEKYSDVTALAYSLYPPNGSPDESQFFVIAVPNLLKYTTQKAVNDDLIDTCTDGVFPLMSMNSDWLVFAGSPCTTDRCKDIAQQVLPTVKLR